MCPAFEAHCLMQWIVPGGYKPLQTPEFCPPVPTGSCQRLQHKGQAKGGEGEAAHTILHVQGKGSIKSPLPACRESLLHPQGVPWACSWTIPPSGYPAPGMGLAACDNKAGSTTVSPCSSCSSICMGLLCLAKLGFKGQLCQQPPVIRGCAWPKGELPREFCSLPTGSNVGFSTRIPGQRAAEAAQPWGAAGGSCPGLAPCSWQGSCAGGGQSQQRGTWGSAPQMTEK